MVEMFNIGMGELVLILLVAFIVVGPQDLPKLARGLARALKQIRGLIEEVKASVDLENEVKAVNEAKQEIVRTAKEFNPLDELDKNLSEVKNELDGAGGVLKDTLKETGNPLKDIK